MNRPDNISAYDEMDLKLGIKSSLPHVKGTLGLAILMWESAGRPAELLYSQASGEEIVLNESVEDQLRKYLNDLYFDNDVDIDDVISRINDNQLFKSQMEALIVAFELIWKLAKVSFLDENKPASAERTGRVRYPKKLMYSVNIDIIHSVIKQDFESYIKVLLSWIGANVSASKDAETTLVNVLAALSENAVFKLADGEKDVIFNQNSIYRKLLETREEVDINGDKEAKGPLRILKSLLSDGLNPYLIYNNGSVNSTENDNAELEEYQKRVDTLLRLHATKVIGLDDLDADVEGLSLENLEEERLVIGQNILLYGVPGSGKSWTIEHEYCHEGSVVERLVFHPDYTNADFIGQILPVVDDEKQVTYEFTPGPFTTILRNAYRDPSREYILIIEEINRGNAPAIFGEVFQLLDRKIEKQDGDDGYPIGTSEYGVTHKYMADYIYGDPTHKVRVPSNLSIVGTMNTSDQNVFTLDTAFQRRWHMRLIENNFNNVRPSLANAEILDTKVTWKRFCETVNNIIVGNRSKMASAEDKRLGVYFVHESEITFDDRAKPSGDFQSLFLEQDTLMKDEVLGKLSESGRQRLTEIREATMKNRAFPEKVIKYLWDDAFKFNPEALFDTESMESLEQVIRTFVYSKGEERFKIFKTTVRQSLYPSDNQGQEDEQ